MRRHFTPVLILFLALASISWSLSGQDQIIYSLTEDNAIYTANLDGTGTPTVLVSPAVTNAYGPVGMFTDFTNGLLYIAGGNNPEIRTAPLSGGSSTILANSTVGAEHFDVYVDAPNSRYFFTSDEVNGLWVANTDGTGSASMVPTSGHPISSPHGLEYDPASNNLYIADKNGQSITSVDATTGVSTQLYSTGSSRPRGLAIDIAAGKIYWTQFSSPSNGGQIYSGNLDGSGSPVLVYSVAAPYLPHGIFIDYVNQNLYWAEFQQFTPGSRIVNAAADGSGSPALLWDLPSTVNLRGVEFGQPLPEPPVAAVPTLSQWGLIFFGLLLLCSGAIAVWRRQYAKELATL